MSVNISRSGSLAQIRIFPKQRAFLESKCDEVLYGGSAGGGKSQALLLFALKRRLEHPGTAGIIFRKTYPELERSLIRESHKIFKLFGAKYNDQKHVWTFPNMSVQEFGHLDSDKSVFEYQSAEYNDIGFDEATHFNEFQLTYMKSRLRTSTHGCQSLMRYATNPGGIGHGYFVRNFIKPYEREKIWAKTDDEGRVTRYTFIPAKVYDNPALMENDPGYVSRLKSLPEKQRMALLDGRWDIFEGQFFTEFNPELHVLKIPRVPDSYTLKYISMDWGFAEPACVLWHEVTPLGRIFTYRELYCTRRSPKELAYDILSLSPSSERYEAMYIPPELYGKKTETDGGGEPIADLLQQGLEGRVRLEKANNARIPGWIKMREYMELAPDGSPWWQISPSCTNLIRTLHELIHDEKKPEDLDTEGEDHAADACRYGLVSLRDVPKAVITPFKSNYDRIFGTKREVRSPMSFGVMPGGRGGY